MIHKAIIATAVAFLMGLLSLPAMATEPADDAHPQRRKRLDSNQEPDVGRMRDRVEKLRKVKMMEVLDLDEENLTKFFSVYTPRQKQIMETRRVLDSLAKVLWKAADETQGNAKELAKATEHYRASLKSLHQSIETMHEAMAKQLDAVTMAKFLAFEARFQSELSRMMMKHAKKGHMPVPPNE